MIPHLFVWLLATGCNQRPDEGTFVGNPGKLELAAARTVGKELQGGDGRVSSLRVMACDGGEQTVALGVDEVVLSFEGSVAVSTPPLTLPEGEWCGLSMSVAELSLSVATPEPAVLSFEGLQIEMSGGTLAVAGQAFGLQLAYPGWLSELDGPADDELLALLGERIERRSALVADPNELLTDPAQQNTEDGDPTTEDLLWAGIDRTEPTDTGSALPTAATGDTSVGETGIDTGGATALSADTGTAPVRVVEITEGLALSLVSEGTTPRIASVGDGVGLVYQDPQLSTLALLDANGTQNTVPLDIGQLVVAPDIAAHIGGFTVVFDQGADVPGIALFDATGQLVAEPEPWQALVGEADRVRVVATSQQRFLSWIQTAADSSTSLVLQALEPQATLPASPPIVVASSVAVAPGLAADDATVALAWVQSVASPFGVDQLEVWARLYDVSGQAFTFRVDVADDTSAASPSVAVAGDHVAVAWTRGNEASVRWFDRAGVATTDAVSLGSGGAPSVQGTDELTIVSWLDDSLLRVQSFDPSTGIADGPPVDFGTQSQGLPAETLSTAWVGEGPEGQLWASWSSTDDPNNGLVWWTQLDVVLQP